MFLIDWWSYGDTYRLSISQAGQFVLDSIKTKPCVSHFTSRLTGSVGATGHGADLNPADTVDKPYRFAGGR